MPARILIAEDEESIVVSLEFLMRGCGYETRVARDGVLAIAELGRFRPDLVLLDLMLPGANGLEVCRALRSGPLAGHARVLMLTAKGGSAEVARALESGADDYMTKPFSTQALVERVRSLLEGGEGRSGERPGNP